MSSQRAEDDAAARPGAAPRGRRLPPDQRREQLVACASALFAERPYAQVSTTEIARAAGIARGLLNHYFGDKRALYLEVVRRAVLLPVLERPAPPSTGSRRARIEESVRWFLDSAELQGATYQTVLGSGMGEDDEVAAILDEADDLAARRLLEVLDLDADEPTGRAMVRAYGGMAKAAVREMLRADLRRPVAHRMLVDALVTVVGSVEQERRRPVE